MQSYPSHSQSVSIKLPKNESENEKDDSNPVVQFNSITGRSIISNKDGSNASDTKQMKRQKLNNVRRQDEARFVDLSHTSDYDNWLKELMDKNLSLNVKGPLANLFFSFTADDESIDDVRRVVVNARRFMTAAGKHVPFILPDLQSEWYQKHKIRLEKDIMKKVSLEYNAESFRDKIIPIIDNSINKGVLLDTKIHTILGLRPMMDDNINVQLFNILNSAPEPSSIRVADFEDGYRSQLVFGYCNRITKDPKRTLEHKESIRNFLTTLPPKPPGDKGYSKGDAEKWVLNKDPHYKSVLLRVLAMSQDPHLRRPDKSKYTGDHCHLCRI